MEVEAVSVGNKVIRGRDWNASRNEDDNGEGTVISLVKDRFGVYARVEWDNGKSGLYRNGFKEKYDLQVAPQIQQSVTPPAKRKSINASGFLECDQCDKKFKSKTALTYHQKNQHPLNAEVEEEASALRGRSRSRPRPSTSPSPTPARRRRGMLQPEPEPESEPESESEPEPEPAPVTARVNARQSVRGRLSQISNYVPFEAQSVMEVSNFSADEEESFGKTIATLLRTVHPTHRAAVMAKITAVISDYTVQE